MGRWIFRDRNSLGFPHLAVLEEMAVLVVEVWRVGYTLWVEIGVGEIPGGCGSGARPFLTFTCVNSLWNRHPEKPVLQEAGRPMERLILLPYLNCESE